MLHSAHQHIYELVTWIEAVMDSDVVHSDIHNVASGLRNWKAAAATWNVVSQANANSL